MSFGAGQNEYWAGAIDEVRVWNRALSEDEVKKNMGQGKEEVIEAVDPREKLATTWGRIKKAKMNGEPRWKFWAF